MNLHSLPANAPALDRLTSAGMPFYWTACGVTSRLVDIREDLSAVTCPGCLAARPPQPRAAPTLPPEQFDFEDVGDDVMAMMGQPGAPVSEVGDDASHDESVRWRARVKEAQPAGRPPLPVPDDQTLLDRMLLDPTLDPGGDLFGEPDVRLVLTVQERHSMSGLLDQIRPFGLAHMAAPIVRTVFRLCDRVTSLQAARLPDTDQDGIVVDETLVQPGHEVVTNSGGDSVVEE